MALSKKTFTVKSENLNESKETKKSNKKQLKSSKFLKSENMSRIDPFNAFLKLKENIKRKTHNSVEDTINEFLNKNIDAKELDVIMNFNRSKSYVEKVEK